MADENINKSEEIEIEIEDASKPGAGDASKADAGKTPKAESGDASKPDAGDGTLPEAGCDMPESDVSEEISEEADEAGPECSSEEADADSEETDADSEETIEAEECEDGTETEKPRKTTMFGRKKKEIEKYQKNIDELTDKLKRNMAEFENFRKRTEKEKSSMYIIGARDIVEKMLPVVDSFERGLSQAPEGDPFAEGMKLVYKQMMTALEDMGVSPIEAVGKEFDPNFHNAVMHVEDENLGENIVAEEFQKGYMYKDFVVRHSMVKVAN